MQVSRPFTDQDHSPLRNLGHFKPMQRPSFT